MANDAHQVSAEIQRLYHNNLLPLIARGEKLVREIPPRKPKLAQFTFLSLAEKVTLLLRNIHTSFQNQSESGYSSTALLTRGLLEISSILLVLNRNPSGELLSAYLQESENRAEVRRRGLEHLKNVKSDDISKAAKNEEKHAAEIVRVLGEIRSKSGLPSSTASFPDMQTRCQALGEAWQFIYDAVYRDLSEAVHAQFTKIPHSPSVAFASSNKGSALLYEHCRTMNYAVEFWGVTVLELCRKNEPADEYDYFREEFGKLLEKTAGLTNQFDPDLQAHQISV